MNGSIIPHTPIAVDFWNARETAARNCRLFFLSHTHADHTVGLTSSWKNHKIYCSELTKKIVIHKIGVGEELIVGLPVDQPFVITMDDVGKENLTVTLIDANHCPGAILFLFQGYFGNILHTGDFRYYSSLSSHPALQHTVIDKLYLDNTYCEPKCVFPTREEAMNMILDVIRKHLDFNIVFGMNTLGKEDLLAKVGITFQKWIGLEPKRMELVKLLDLPDVFTCDVESTNIRAVMKKEVSKRNLQIWNDEHPTIAILPTALFEGETNFYQNMENVYVIPFSDHSSFDELRTFVSEIKPKEIVPLVLRHRGAKGDPSNMRVNMAVFDSYLNKEPLSAIAIPETVLQFMGTRAVPLKVKRRTKSFGAPKQKRQKCMGVVFSDEEEDTRKTTVQDPCDQGLKKPENRADCPRKMANILEDDKVIITGFISVPERKEDIKVGEEVVLKNACVLEGVKACTTNSKRSTSLQQINTEADGGLITVLKGEKDIQVQKDLILHNSCQVMEEVRTIKFQSELKEKELKGKMNGKNENREGLSNNTTSNKLTIAKNIMSISTVDAIPNTWSSDDKHLALELLETFNYGEHEDEYTINNPVYKKFVGHFCEYLKIAVATEETLEDDNNENNQSNLDSSPRTKHKPKMETLHSQQKKYVTIDLDDSEEDSDENSGGFSWFSSQF